MQLREKTRDSQGIQEPKNRFSSSDQSVVDQGDNTSEDWRGETRTVFSKRVATIDKFDVDALSRDIREATT